MKYYVIAKKYDGELGKQVKYIAGQFPTYHLAEMFRIAYNEYYKADAMIVHESNLLQWYNN